MLTKAERKYMAYDEKALIKLFSGSLYGKTVTVMKGANMITKEKYQKELVRMWDSLRKNFKGSNRCDGVFCSQCPLKGCCGTVDSFETIERVEKWSKEHPQKVRKDEIFNNFDDVMSLFAFGKIDSSDLISIERWYNGSTQYRWKVVYFGFEK